MPKGVVLFDVLNTLVKEAKDESGFLAEAIRGIYGFSVDVKESDYDGVAMQEAIEAILLRNGAEKDYIEGGLRRIMEELPYSYYNVAGHDRIIAENGAKEVLNGLRRDGFDLGIATGAAKGMVANMFARAEVDFSMFKFGVYGDAGKTMGDIMKVAAETVPKDAGVSIDRVFVVSSAPAVVAAAKAAGLTPIGVHLGKSTEAELSGAGAKAVARDFSDRKTIRKVLEG
jgi:phosphoglycolate phosphatase-like HAD superfamily hydrolase